MDTVFDYSDNCPRLESRCFCFVDLKFGARKVLVSGYTKSTLNLIQSIMATLSPGSICAVSVDGSFEEAASQYRKLCAAIHEQRQGNNTCYRDIDFEV